MDRSVTAAKYYNRTVFNINPDSIPFGLRINRQAVTYCQQIPKTFRSRTPLWMAGIFYLPRLRHDPPLGNTRINAVGIPIFAGYPNIRSVARQNDARRHIRPTAFILVRRIGTDIDPRRIAKRINLYVRLMTLDAGVACFHFQSIRAQLIVVGCFVVNPYFQIELGRR